LSTESSKVKKAKKGMSLFLICSQKMIKGIRGSILKRFQSTITQSEYALRRQKIQELLPPNGVVLVPGYGLRYSTSSIFYPFHQNTDLLYLSGFNEPNSLMVLTKDKMELFCQPFDINTEKWDGKRIGLGDAVSKFGADKSYPISELSKYLKSIVNEDYCIITELPINAKPSIDLLKGTNINTNQGSATHIEKQVNELVKTKAEISPLGNIIDRFRLFKSSKEIEIMRKSGKIAGNAFKEAIKATKPGITEHQLHSTLEYHCKMNGATALSYVPVVASGKNALILHYVVNNDVLKDGDMVLVDCGCEYEFYASDITRTWPINGKFTKPQKLLYQLVLDSQKYCIEKVVIGETSLNGLQDLAYEFLKNGLEKLFDRKIERSEMNELYPHHVSHYIGLDVHDVNSIPRSIILEKGMCLTIGVL
jgi:intermediate cleaving peptidase 55